MSNLKLQTLVLDAGPLLSLNPLRGLAERYVTVPQVISELKDSRVREHLERLELSFGVKLEVLDPDAASLAKVTTFSKRTGDYSVLSLADLRILALACSLHDKAQGEPNQLPKPELSHDNSSVPQTGLATPNSTTRSTPESSQPNDQPATSQTPAPCTPEVPETSGEADDDEVPEFEREPLDVDATPFRPQAQEPLTAPLYDDPSSDDDGAGEWITPDNVA
ncbi:Nin1 binding protein, partial [Ceratobasidium sp. 395]